MTLPLQQRAPLSTVVPWARRHALRSTCVALFGCATLIACSGAGGDSAEPTAPRAGESRQGASPLTDAQGDGPQGARDPSVSPGAHDDDADADVNDAGAQAAANARDADAQEPLPADAEIVCRIPPVAVARPAACAQGAEYPECKWAMPGTEGSGGLYRRWRNTIPEHTWGRPALVGVLLATAHAFHERFPDQELLIGDLDAPGPRHQTHKTGVDVDLYLPNTLLVENIGARRYRDNYRHMSNANIELARQRVETLARILAVCTEGRVRIYYNDTVVRDRFHAWFDGRGMETPFGRPMQRHNRLHDFHFHVSIAEDTPVPEWLAPYAGQHPVREIGAAPEIEGVTVFARERPQEEGAQEEPRGEDAQGSAQR